jgi:hypothetical protein
MQDKIVHILDFPMTEIEDILSNVLSGERFNTELKKGVKISNIYFAGASLMIDIRGLIDRGSVVDIIVLRHSSESYNLFSGGLEMLLSIKALKTLEQIMFINDIKHQTKWLN